MVYLYIVMLLLLFGLRFTQAAGQYFEPTTPKIDISDLIIHSWAEYSPVFPLDEYKPPVGCDITQVNILHRHGARFPTSNAGARIQSAISILKNATQINDPRLKFIESYTYDLGHDDLIAFGAAQSFDAGQEAFSRYSHLVSKSQIPFVRASSSSRVVFSATNWTAGFIHANRGTIIPASPLILNEAANDTLDDSSCPNAGTSDPQTTTWQNTFGPPIARRLNTAAFGANITYAHPELTPANIPDLISLCPFDTLAKERVSPWCDVFTPAEFADFEYFGDLDKYYGTGYGQPLGRIQGVGYVNELIARLTGTPVHDQTQSNKTLDTSSATFPLNRTIYADFSHDNEMIAIYAALGIVRPGMALDPERPDPRRGWKAARLVPFSGRLVVEKLLCGEESGLGRKGNGKEESVRVLLNDEVVPLPMCGAGTDGVCSLDAFIRNQAYARSNGAGDFEKCFD